MKEDAVAGKKFGVVSAVVLKVAAGAVWLIGGVILTWKGSSLLLEAAQLNNQAWGVWLGFPAGILLGAVKGFKLFIPSCRKNLTRIDALQSPRIWQFFSPRFLLLLTLMIAAGSALSRLAHGKFLLLIPVGVLDLSIAWALLISFPAFWIARK